MTESTGPTCGGASKPAMNVVPGEFAPSSQILKLWNSMGRLLLKSKTPFAKFLHSLKSLPLLEDRSTASTTWPMPLPYPHLLRPENADSAQVPFPIRALQKALNLIVAMLDWLHMGQPEVCPRALALHRPLTLKQWRVVRKFESLLEEVQFSKTIKASDMGRAAAKVESLGCSLGSAARSCC